MKNFRHFLTTLTIAIFCSSVNAQVQIIETIAGTGVFAYSGDGGPAISAELAAPWGITVSDSGNVYIADYQNQRIRKINKSGVITSIAGNGVAGFSGDGGKATKAGLNGPTGIAIDKSGNLYIADYNNQRIRKVSTAGIISTVAGNGGTGYSGDGVKATLAKLNFPTGVAVDKYGNIFIADQGNGRVRKVDATGIISTIAGPGVGYSGDSTVSVSPGVNDPWGVAVDTSGNVYVADAGYNQIRKISPLDTIISIAGNGAAGYSGDSGKATSASLNNPWAVAVDNSGNVYIADESNNRIRKVDNTGIITTMAGNGAAGYSGDGDSAILATLHSPNGIITDTLGNVFFADQGNNVIREIYTVSAPIANFIANDTTICTGDSIHFTDNSLHTPAIWNWYFAGGAPSSSAIQNPSVTYSTPGVYSVKLVVTNFGGADSLTKTAYIHVDSLPTVTISGSPTLCIGADILTAIPSGKSPFTYNWSTAGTYDTIQVNAPNTFYVTVTDPNGCKAKSTDFIVSKDSVPAIHICFVTVDTASKHNIIVWDKSGLTRVDSFKVYYYNSSSQWALIGSQPFATIGQFTDTTPINNPNANTVRYSLTAVDSCGKEEPIASSPWQNTMYINQSPPGTFIWSGTGYLIEGVALPVITYYLYRDSISTGNWKAIDSVSGTQNKMSDPNYSNYPNGRWYVSAKLNVSGCPSPVFLKMNSSTTTLSRSNQQVNVVAGMVNIGVPIVQVNIYPNPASTEVNFQVTSMSTPITSADIYDITGQKVNSYNMHNNLLTMSTQGYAAGLYFYQLYDKNGSLLKSGKFSIAGK